MMSRIEVGYDGREEGREKEVVGQNWA